MLQRLKRTLRALYFQRTHAFDTPTTPHFDDETLARFRHELATCKSYLEYGSGGSTILVDGRGIEATSVESDRFYANAVRRGLSPTSRVKMVVPRVGLVEEWGRPVFNYGNKGKRYVDAGFAGEAFPELILVDGRYRAACALESARRAHEGKCAATLIFDDYESRPHYHVVEQYLGPPERVGRSAVFRLGSRAVPEEAVRTFAKDPR